MTISSPTQPLMGSRHHAALRASYADPYPDSATITRPAVASSRSRGFVRQPLLDADTPPRDWTPTGQVLRITGVPSAQASLTGVALCRPPTRVFLTALSCHPRIDNC